MFTDCYSDIFCENCFSNVIQAIVTFTSEKKSSQAPKYIVFVAIDVIDSWTIAVLTLNFGAQYLIFCQNDALLF